MEFNFELIEQETAAIPVVIKDKNGLPLDLRNKNFKMDCYSERNLNEKIFSLSSDNTEIYCDSIYHSKLWIILKNNKTCHFGDEVARYDVLAYTKHNENVEKILHGKIKLIKTLTKL